MKLILRRQKRWMKNKSIIFRNGVILKNPNDKIQISNQAQNPKSKTFLTFELWILFGI
jgi:hypothetical protein